MSRHSWWVVVGLWMLGAGLLAQEAVEPLKTGDKLPSVILSDEKGEPFCLSCALKEKEAKGALLVVWSVSCPVCDQAMPTLEKLHQQAKKDKVLFHGLVVDAGVQRADLPKHRERKKVTFISGLDPEKAIARRLGVRATPTVLLIGHDLTVQAVYQGFTGDIAQAMQRDLTEYVATGKVTGPAPQAAHG